MSGAFDGNTYRKAVLRPMLNDPPAVLDPFVVFDLAPDEDDQAVIDQRITDVIACWRREQTSGRFRALATRLLDEREALSAVVRDPERRAAARVAAQAARDQADQAVLARFDDMVHRLVRAHPGGVPRSRVERLRALAARDGIAVTELESRLAGVTVIDDGAEPLPESERAHVRSTLAAYNQLIAGSGGPGARPARSLFDVLGVEASARDEEVLTRLDALATRNRQRRHDRLRTVTDELLVLADRHTHGPGRARYQATMVVEARDQLTRDIEGILLAEDRVGAADFEHLVRRAVGLGLDPAGARAAVIAAAAELGGAVETGPAVDYLLCPACGAVEPVGGRRTCRRCHTDLYRSCPSCSREIEASALRCGHCGADLQALAELERERRQRFEAAQQLHGIERERALGELLADHPDYAPALRLLAQTPPAPPTRAEAVAEGGSITVRWAPSESPGVTGYRVTRYQGDGRARPVAQTTELALEDAGARLDETVRYEIVAIRGGRGSAPAEVELAPGGPAAAVHLYLDVDPEAGVIRLAPAGDVDSAAVRIVRSTAAPPEAGARLTTAELEGRGTVVAGGTDDLDGGPRWYVPVTVEGTTGVAGVAAGHPGLPPVSDVEAADTGGHILVRWSWPPGCTECRVSWRGPTEPGEAKVTNMKYEIDGGYRLAATAPGPYEITVVPGARLGRDLVWGPAPEPVRHVRE